jgi:hypothetical protein
MTDSYSGRGSAQVRMTDADQAEQAAIRLGSAVFDVGVYDQKIAGAMDDFDPMGLNVASEWQRQDLEVDSAVGKVHEEISRRAAAMGNAYPFLVSATQLTYKPSETGFYEFCLAASLVPNLSKGNYAKFPRVFERIVTVLIREYLGIHAHAIHVGSPRDASVGTTFVKAMKYVHEKSKELIWSPRPGLPSDPETKGDEGVDFIAWKEPLDKRNGSLFILGQCACGDDWTGKFADVSLPRIEKWFQPFSFVKPVTAFASPRHIANEWLNEALGQAGLVFDRARLVLLAEQAHVAAHLKPWAEEIKQLVEFAQSPSGKPPAKSVTAAANVAYILSESMH